MKSFIWSFVLVIGLLIKTSTAVASNINAEDFKTGLCQSVYIRGKNWFTCKASGFPLVHNSKTLYGLNLYLSNPRTPWNNPQIIGKKGTFVVWSLYQSVSLWEGQRDKFNAIFQRAYSGKLVSYSAHNPHVTIESSNGKRLTLKLTPSSVKFYDLQGVLSSMSENNVGWDGDIVGLTDQVGFLVSFIPQ